MSRHSDSLARSQKVIARVLTQIPDRKLTRYELACEHADAWAADQPPKGDERGGSSSPREASDRREEQGVKRRAAQATTRLTANALAVERLLNILERDVIFLTAITDDTPEGESGELPGCRSCARVDVFAPVWDRVPSAKTAGMCRFCWEHRGPNDQPPAVALVELHHSGTRRELSAWLTKNMPDRSKATPEAPPCGTVWTHLGRDHTCYRAQGHEGECAGVNEHGERVTWTRAA